MRSPITDSKKGTDIQRYSQNMLLKTNILSHHRKRTVFLTKAKQIKSCPSLAGAGPVDHLHFLLLQPFQSTVKTNSSINVTGSAIKLGSCARQQQLGISESMSFYFFNFLWTLNNQPFSIRKFRKICIYSHTCLSLSFQVFHTINV